MDCGLRVELQQKLIMTPQLRQALAVLQLSSLDLASLIEKELADNPALEIDEIKTALDDQSAAGQAEQQVSYADWADYLGSGKTFDDWPPAEAEPDPGDIYADHTVSLEEHLVRQLDFADVGDDIRAAGVFLIGCIDDNGYLRSSVAEAAAILKQREEIVERALVLIQTFDPEGVGARDLRECLALQLKMKNMEDGLAGIIVSDYLGEVAKGRCKAIADKLGVEPHDVQKAVDVIRTLNPKPGQVFGKNKAGYIVPDITVEKINGKYTVLVNDSMVPRLTISPYYRRLAHSSDQDTKRFLDDRLNAAVWVVKSIEQRRRTLYNVTKALTDLQYDFFEYGPGYLRPLVMRQVADYVGIHESTVSRATANKYVATPYGIFSMRSFFTAGVAGIAGQEVSAVAVKREIRRLIDGEDAASPYSDQSLSDILKKSGIVVSRRTVAKYREEMNIASSGRRKRY